MEAPCHEENFVDSLANLTHSQPKLLNITCEGLSHDRSHEWVPVADSVDT